MHLSPTMSFTPSKPRPRSQWKKLTQLALSSFIPSAAPKTSRKPSLFTAMQIAYTVIREYQQNRWLFAGKLLCGDLLTSDSSMNSAGRTRQSCQNGTVTLRLRKQDHKNGILFFHVPFAHEKSRLCFYKRFNGLSFIHLLYCLRTKSAYNRGGHREYGQ